ncbi:hypothetical protein KM043_017901 [Ampulex compressa]|nr:hypothetical protein KM043_017901 [Ampulex compressa]
MGLTVRCGITNLIIPDNNLTWPVPQAWTLEDAATVPCVYATSYYALYLNGKMKKGDKVLIHAGTSCVGQAAIYLAIHEGCEVFTTVGTSEKRRFIRETFPCIDDEHIGNSRNTSFEQLILKKTIGRGVDIILNSLPEDKLQASLRCLAPKGRFLEIGRFDLTSKSSVGMEIFLKEVNFQRVMLGCLIETDTDEKIQLWNLLTDGLRNGVIKPLLRTVFRKEEAEAALRYVASGKHIGKVLIKICNTEMQLDAPIIAQPRFHCHPDRNYVIIGGLGGFGLELANWLVFCGAKHLILVSRNGLKNSYQRARIELWKSYGTQVSIVTGLDISTMNDCEFLLRSAEEVASVDGIFNVALVLNDGLCTNQTSEKFAQSFAPKAWATEKLDVVSRKLCPKLRHFVVFSSTSCGKGNPGQTNYGMSNSVMERICEKRVTEGHPGLAIQWGAIGEVGIVADLKKDNETIIVAGTIPQDISSCLEVLVNFMLQHAPVVSSMVVSAKNTDRVNLSSLENTIANVIGLTDLRRTDPASQNCITIQDMVDFILPDVINNMKEQQEFVVVGHSFGAIIALELAQRLEIQALTGKIILIDGSPEVLTTLLRQSFPTSLEEIQNKLLINILDVHNSISAESQFLSELNNCGTWEQKLDLVMARIPVQKLQNNPENHKVFYNTIYTRIRALWCYDFSQFTPIRSPITLLKASEQILKCASPDCGLKQLTRGKLETFIIPGDHVTILTHEKVIAAINGELEAYNKE